MPNALIVSRDERQLAQIKQDLVRRAFLFWRTFSVTLTTKRLHSHQKFLLSDGQKTFDLRDIDSVYQQNRFNGIRSFFMGVFTWMLIAMPAMLTLERDENTPSLALAIDLIGFCVGVAVFILYFFRRMLVVRSRNDEMAIDTLRMPEGELGSFVQLVLRQKEAVVGSEVAAIIEERPPDAADKIRQLSALRSQGLITQEEYDKKRAQLLQAM